MFTIPAIFYVLFSTTYSISLGNPIGFLNSVYSKRKSSSLSQISFSPGISHSSEPHNLPHHASRSLGHFLGSPQDSPQPPTLLSHLHHHHLLHILSIYFVFISIHFFRQLEPPSSYLLCEPQRNPAFLTPPPYTLHLRDVFSKPSHS